jgi:DNA polymerase V
LQFRDADLRWVKKNFTVVGGRTLLELRGVRCLPLELEPPPKESITCSRSFGDPIIEYKPLQMAMSCYLMSAVEKMRHHRLAARSLTVFIETNKFQLDSFYANSYTYKSAYLSDNLFELQHWASESIKKIYREILLTKSGRNLEWFNSV